MSSILARWVRATPVLAVALAGCYTFTPVEGLPSPGETVRANLSGPGALRLSEITGEPTRHMVGDVAQITDEQVHLVILLGHTYTQHQPRFEVRDTLPIPRQDVVSFERRELSKLRTALAVAGLGGGVAYLFYRAESGRGGDSDGDVPGQDGPTALRIPILRLPSPF